MVEVLNRRHFWMVIDGHVNFFNTQMPRLFTVSAVFSNAVSVPVTPCSG